MFNHDFTVEHEELDSNIAREEQEGQRAIHDARIDGEQTWYVV